MKGIFGLLIGVISCATFAHAGDVVVEAFMTTAPRNEAVTAFATETANIFAIFKTEGLKEGDKLRGVLVAEDVGDAAPANTNVLEKTLAMDADTEAGEFTFIKPTNGWPIGKYRVEIYVNDELATKVKFTVKAAKSKKHSDEEEEEEEESGD